MPKSSIFLLKDGTNVIIMKLKMGNGIVSVDREDYNTKMHHIHESNF